MKKLFKKFSDWFDEKLGWYFTNPHHYWRWQERQKFKKQK